MADLETLTRLLNPVVLNLQKMELELMCPICLKLLDLPVMLPCNHIICSYCITNLTKDGLDCPSCKLPFIHKDLRPADHLKTLIDIYKNMNSAVTANILRKRSQGDIYDKRAPSSVTPVSGNKGPKDNTRDELDPNMIRDKSPSSLMQSSLFRNMNMMRPSSDKDETDKLATHGNKKLMPNTRVETCVDQAEPCSPPSFGNNKGSDSDSSDQGSERKIKRSPTKTSSCKDLNIEIQHVKEVVVEPKRQKLDKELDFGGPKCSAKSKNAMKPNYDFQSNQGRCPETQPLQTSNISNTSKIVECVFCHSFRTTEASGEMLHYLNGEQIAEDQACQSNVLHVHQKCIEWAPQVYFSGDTAMKLDAEVSRASKIKCSHCGLKGAALGCYVKSCRKSFHVPCAYAILECRWDCENYLMLCPAHSSNKLPSDKSRAKKKTMADHSSSDSSNFSDDLNPCGGVWTASADVTKCWVFCGSALSKPEKVLLDKFARLTGAAVADEYKATVTHVIASTDDHGACTRTLKFLLAILSGKWVLNMEWVRACMEARKPVAEEPYEVTHDVHGCFDGPKNGRIRTMEKAPGLFSGLSFYFSGYFMPSYKGYLEDLVLAAGGALLKKDDFLLSGGSSAEKTFSNSFVVYSVEPPQGYNPNELSDVIKRRSEEAEAFADENGSRVIPHTWLLDTIAACNLQMSI